MRVLDRAVENLAWAEFRRGVMICPSIDIPESVMLDILGERYGGTDKVEVPNRSR